MTNLQTADDLCPDVYISPATLNGRRIPVTIKGFARENVFNPGTKKTEEAGVIVISAGGREKRWVMNKTNKIVLTKMFKSNKLKVWMGKVVFLFATTEDGKEVVRICGSPDLEKPCEISVKLSGKPVKKYKMVTALE